LNVRLQGIRHPSGVEIRIRGSREAHAGRRAGSHAGSQSRCRASPSSRTCCEARACAACARKASVGREARGCARASRCQGCRGAHTRGWCATIPCVDSKARRHASRATEFRTFRKADTWDGSAAHVRTISETRPGTYRATRHYACRKTRCASCASRFRGCGKQTPAAVPQPAPTPAVKPAHPPHARPASATQAPPGSAPATQPVMSSVAKPAIAPAAQPVRASSPGQVASAGARAAAGPAQPVSASAGSRPAPGAASMSASPLKIPPTSMKGNSPVPPSSRAREFL
jgi:hypothetical protein